MIPANSFPSEASQFYALRDERTNRYGVEARYQESHCFAIIGAAFAETMEGQVMLMVSCNLLSRWCRNVTIVGPVVKPHDFLKSKHASLQDLILEQMQLADPFGNFVAKSEVPADLKGIVLQIGPPTASNKHPSTVFINAAGWLASVSYSEIIPLRSANPLNCLGAIAAACLGGAEIFKMATRDSQQPITSHSGVFDLFALSHDEEGVDEHPYPSRVDLGSLLMVGAGSVASAAAYCLRVARISCEMVVVDNDRVKIENFNRSPIFDRNSFGANKAMAIARFLEGSDVKATPFAGWWDDFFKQTGRSDFNFDVWLPLANEYGVRSAMQNNVPPLMIHASTTANWGVNHARHIPGHDDCLLDRFPETTVTDRLTCATGPVVLPTATVDAALPFLSLFGGLLIVADLIRIHLPEYPQVPNFALFDFGGSFLELQKMNKRPSQNCVCKSHNAGLHQGLNGKTKYWQLSSF